MKSSNIKRKAINYRKQGYSYSMISKKLGLAKSTLSNWLHDIPFEPNKKVLSRIKKNRRNLVKTMYQRRCRALKHRRKIQHNAKQEVKKLTKEDLRYIGAALYLGEGYKSQKVVRITNSDPRVIKLVILWLKEICGVKLKDLRAAVHLYPDNNIRKSIRFWSNISGIPISQFQKTQVDRRTKKSKIKRGKLPHGTLHISVRESRNLFYKISGWIEGILENANNDGPK